MDTQIQIGPTGKKLLPLTVLRRDGRRDGRQRARRDGRARARPWRNPWPGFSVPLHNGLMPQLIAPDTRIHASFLDAMKEFVGEGADEHSLLLHEMAEFGTTWHRPEAFATYVERLNAEPLEETPRIEGWVPNTTLWYVEGEYFLGRLAIRHRLNPFLRELGGHIGYAVRPTARRQGHATAMLAASLPVARAIGLDSVLVTCDTTNIPSRKVIEAVGGVLEDQRGGKLRFWIRTDV